VWAGSANVALASLVEMANPAVLASVSMHKPTLRTVVVVEKNALLAKMPRRFASEAPVLPSRCAFPDTAIATPIGPRIV
jgi:hypothetical protein